MAQALYPAEHRFGNIYTGDAPRRAGFVQKIEGGRSATAADIDSGFAGLYGRTIDQHLGDGAKDDVLKLLPVRPVFAAGAVPVGNLICIAGIDGRLGHGTLQSCRLF